MKIVLPSLAFAIALTLLASTAIAQTSNIPADAEMGYRSQTGQGIERDADSEVDLTVDIPEPSLGDGQNAIAEEPGFEDRKNELLQDDRG